jgi:Immunity protein 21
MSDLVVPRPFWNDGGPLIAVPDAAIAHWEGIDPPSNGRVVTARVRWSEPGDPATDYDRACDVDAESAVALTVGDSWGIVLGTAVAQDAQWLPTDQRDQFYLVGIETIEDGHPARLRRLAEEQLPDAWQVLLERAPVGPKGVLLAHAACRLVEVKELSALTSVPEAASRGAVIGDALRFAAPEGFYRVEACEIARVKAEVLTFVRFQRQP